MSSFPLLPPVPSMNTRLPLGPVVGATPRHPPASPLRMHPLRPFPFQLSPVGQSLRSTPPTLWSRAPWIVRALPFLKAGLAAGALLGLTYGAYRFFADLFEPLHWEDRKHWHPLTPIAPSFNQPPPLDEMRAKIFFVHPHERIPLQAPSGAPRVFYADPRVPFPFEFPAPVSGAEKMELIGQKGRFMGDPPTVSPLQGDPGFERSIITVNLGQVGKAVNPDVLDSNVLRPCIAIGFYDPQRQIAYMIHRFHAQYPNLEEVLQRMQEDGADLAQLQIVATGGGGSQPEVAENKSSIEQTLGKYFQPHQMRIQWSPLGSMTRLYIDTATGQFLITRDR